MGLREPSSLEGFLHVLQYASSGTSSSTWNCVCSSLIHLCLTQLLTSYSPKPVRKNSVSRCGRANVRKFQIQEHVNENNLECSLLILLAQFQFWFSEFSFDDALSATQIRHRRVIEARSWRRRWRIVGRCNKKQDIQPSPTQRAATHAFNGTSTLTHICWIT